MQLLSLFTTHHEIRITSISIRRLPLRGQHRRIIASLEHQETGGGHLIRRHEISITSLRASVHAPPQKPPLPPRRNSLLQPAIPQPHRIRRGPSFSLPLGGGRSSACLDLTAHRLPPLSSASEIIAIWSLTLSRTLAALNGVSSHSSLLRHGLRLRDVPPLQSLVSAADQDPSAAPRRTGYNRHPGS